MSGNSSGALVCLLEGGRRKGVFAPGEVARVSGARYKDMTRVLEDNIDILRAPGEKTL